MRVALPLPALCSILCLCPTLVASFHVSSLMRGPGLAGGLDARRKVAVGSDFVAARLESAPIAMCDARATVSSSSVIVQDDELQVQDEPPSAILGPTGQSTTSWKPWKRFARAGSVTPMRMAHSGLGLASLFYGTTDFLNVVVHRGLPVISYTDAVTHGVIATISAALSLPRVQNKWTQGKLWHLWMPAAREASIPLAVIQNAWHALILLSDLARPPDDAWFAVDQPLFLLYTWFSSCFTFYVTVRIMLENDDNNSGLYATQRSNALFGLALGVFFWSVALKALFLAYDPAAHVELSNLVAAYPEYTQTISGVVLLTLYINNLGWALSSAEHYGIITKAQIGDLTSAISAVSLVLTCDVAVRVDTGRMAISDFLITWDAMLHALTSL